jgi:histidinol-phosphatase
MPAYDSEAIHRDLALAQRAALAGARLGLEYFERVQDLPQERKADGTIGTEADRAVEQTVRSTLLSGRPDDACLGEETGESGSGPRRWILDGIDGTIVFVAGGDGWQSLIALEQDGQIVVGVSAVPVQGQIWWAARGLGAYVADFEGESIGEARQLAVAAPPAAIASTRLGVVPPLELIDSRRRPGAERTVEPLISTMSRRPWSAHPGLLVAAGELDLAVQALGSVWDFAAISLIVEEAGGRFSGRDGQAHPVTGVAVFSSGAALHETALAHLG